MLRNQVVEISEVGGEVTGYYPFMEEIPYTEWMNGLIVLSYNEPIISAHTHPDPINDFVALYIGPEKEIRSVLPLDSDMTFLTLKAYYVTMFNVSEVSFSLDSRVIQLC